MDDRYKLNEKYHSNINLWLNQNPKQRSKHMKITNHLFDKINDPTGIIEGDRYEFLLDLEVDEEDELFTEGGVDLRVILASDEKGLRIVQYFFTDKGTKTTMDFALEDDEEAEIIAYCKEKIG